MKNFKKWLALAATMSLFVGQVQGQDALYYDDASAAYEASGSASYLSAALPIGAIAVAAIIIATTNRHHHHHSSSSSDSSSSSSRGYFSHSGCY